ncbi:MAG TPA: serine hydrolase domain-containing protein [Caulobacteraceae bacterium]
MTNTHSRGSSATPSVAESAAEKRARSPAELRVDELLAPFTPDKPSLAILVTKGGAPVFERYLGAADIEHGEAATAATGFHIASASKQFTAFAALLEADAGRLELEADVHDYLPELPDFGERITVADLVHHTAGLRDVADLLGLCGLHLGGIIRQPATVALILRQRELNFPPGTRCHYSNSGYTLLAEIVSRTSGRPFPRYVEAEVFAPLGMAGSIVRDNDGRLLANEAKSYRLNARGEPRRLPMNNSCYGPRGVYTTARDLAKWAQELLHPRVFQPELIARMTAPSKLRDGTAARYGFGLLAWTLAGRPAISHYGGDQGYVAAFHCFPDDDASVIALSSGQAMIDPIEVALVEAFLGGTPAARGAPDPATLAGLEGYYVGGGGPGLTLAVCDGKLTASGGGWSDVEAGFVPDGDFYLNTPPYRFTRTPAGDLVGPDAGWSTALTHRRRTRVQPSAASLAAIAGVYRSDEVDSTYELTAMEGGLTLTSLRFGPVAFTPADEDAFDSPEFRLTIVRDGEGAPTGFRLSTWGSWNLWFERIG